MHFGDDMVDQGSVNPKTTTQVKSLSQQLLRMLLAIAMGTTVF